MNVEYLEIIFENEDPIDLKNLIEGLNSILQLYIYYTNDNNIKFEVPFLKKGSPFKIILKPVGKLFNYGKEFIEKFKKDSDNFKINNFEDSKIQKDYNKKYKYIIKFFEISINKSTTINNYYNNKVDTYYSSEKEKKEIIKNIQEQLKDDCEIIFYEKQLFNWEQTNFKSDKQGNKGIIKNIYNKSLIVKFNKSYIKEQMMNGDNWQNLNYSVDVEVQYNKDNVPTCYLIKKCYEEETFK